MTLLYNSLEPSSGPSSFILTIMNSVEHGPNQTDPHNAKIICHEIFSYQYPKPDAFQQLSY